MFKNLLLSNRDIAVEDVRYRRLLMTNLAYLCSMSVFFVFAFVDTYIRHVLVAGLLNALFFFPTLYGYWRLRRDLDIDKAAKMITALVFTVTIMMLFLYRYEEYIAAWGMLFPFVAMGVCGYKKGLYWVIAFDLVFYAGALYYWFEGTLASMAVVRLINVSLFILVLVYLYEKIISVSYERQKALEATLRRNLAETRTMAVTDALTGLYNKRYFDQIFSVEFNRAKREHRIFHLALLDIDNFKRYNDTYGHDRGDIALKRVGRILRDMTKRSGDFAFRVGGEEFALILHSCPMETCALYLEKLRERIAAEKIEHKNNPPYDILTISIGSVSVTNYDAITPESMYRIADENLYEVKRHGRNAVRHTSVAPVLSHKLV